MVPLVFVFQLHVRMSSIFFSPLESIATYELEIYFRCEKLLHNSIEVRTIEQLMIDRFNLHSTAQTGVGHRRINIFNNDTLTNVMYDHASEPRAEVSAALKWPIRNSIVSTLIKKL